MCWDSAHPRFIETMNPWMAGSKPGHDELKVGEGQQFAFSRG
jgi:hypothetical protein